MDVTIRVADDDITELGSLWSWLRAERVLTGSVRAHQKAIVDGELGGAVELLSVALGSGGAVMALANSLTTWLRTRRSDITITVKTATGSVNIRSSQAKNTEEVIALLDSAMRHDPET